MADRSLREVVYTPGAQLHRPRTLLRQMFRDLVASRELAWRLFIRDTAAQYRQTALGYFWAVFPPVVTSLVFIVLNSSNMLGGGDLGVPYAVYVVMGTVFFGLFVDALNAPLKIVSASKTMLVKVNFPREALLLAAVAQVLFSFMIKIVLLVLTLIVFGVGVTATAPLTLVPLTGLLVIGTMLGVMIVPLGLLYQDVSYTLALAATALMLLSPVGFPPPESGALATVMDHNPLTPLLMSAREFALDGHSAYLGETLIVIAVSAALLFAGWVLFRLGLPIFIERIGA